MSFDFMMLNHSEKEKDMLEEYSNYWLNFDFLVIYIYQLIWMKKKIIKIKIKLIWKINIFN